MKTFVTIIFWIGVLVWIPGGVLWGSQNSNRQFIEKNGVDLGGLQTIQLPSSPNAAELKVSRLLHQKLRDHYGVHLRIVNQDLPGNGHTILVGPELALASHMVSSGTLEDTGRDEYVLAAKNERVAIAGAEPQGTLYGAYAFLRKIGIKFYPWHLGKEIEVLEPLNGRVLAPFIARDAPFFELRDLFPRFERGQYGTSIRQYTLGDLRFANKDPNFKPNGYLGWDHTAGYLVPLHKYYDGHPEYFGFRNGRRIPRSTPNLRVSLCMGNPDVHRIAAERTVEWIRRQPHRRFYMVSDGDSPTGCRAPESLAMDPIPDYYTDRALTWVNSVARRVKASFPDKIVLTLAYMGTVKLPVETKPETNVRILYAPWFWDSRLSSAVSLNHPLNKTAFTEFSEWVGAAPGQIGVYDYPGNFVFGTAERIKLYAQHGVRWMYFNGGDGELLHWVAARLLWDPTLDTDALVAEFTRIFYGPGASIMNAHLKLRKRTIDRNAMHSMVIFDDPEFLTESRSTIQALEVMARDQSPELRIRILEGVSDILYTILLATRPSRTKLSGEQGRLDMDRFRVDLQHYVGVQKQIVSLCRNTQNCRNQIGMRKRNIYRSLKRLNLIENAKLKYIAWQPNKDLDPIYEAVQEGAEKHLSAFRRIQKTFASPAAQNKRLDFRAAESPRFWQMDASDPSVVLNSHTKSEAKESRDDGEGVRLSAPMSRFPTVHHGNKTVHAGRVSAQRRFDPPLDIGGYRYVDIHLYASGAIPATIYIDRGIQTRSDVNLIAGKQVVRIDFGNFIDHRWNPPKWEDRLYSISFDFWPQDNTYPYPQARDVDLRISGIELTNTDSVSDRGPALYMTHFRTNKSIRRNFLNAVATPYTRLMRSTPGLKPLGQHYLRANATEKFRTVTVHRILSPITRIVTLAGDTEAEGAASRFREFLTAAWGITLPHETARRWDEPTNSFFLQTTQDLDGFQVEALDGIVKVEGRTSDLMLQGLREYLSLNGMPSDPHIRNGVDGRDGDTLIHEFRVDHHPKGLKRPARKP